MTIIRLSDSMVNQIAAGEVVERPASVVKELVENAIDAGATRVEIVTASGGKGLIRITDNGSGMSRNDLSLAIERHCTSKLTDDLLDIRTLGFRGEALPSIGSVARMTITSRARGADEAWKITVDNGRIDGPRPAALGAGTVIEVSDLFARVPARLKFMKTDRAEAAAITDVVKRMALAFPHIHFALSGSDRSATDWPSTDAAGRAAQVLGREFIDNALEIDAEREGIRLFGLAGLPTFNRGNALQQFFFVNGRPVRDKALLGATRGAYSDFLARDRHAVLALFLEVPPREVDVNVHPAKADVRFRDPGLVRGLLVGSIRQAVSAAGHRASTEGGSNLASAFRTETASGWNGSGVQAGFGGGGYASSASYSRPPTDMPDWNRPLNGQRSETGGFGESGQAGYAPSAAPSAQAAEEAPRFPLGAARAQLHENYIVAQTEAGLVIVDQHAAHERIVYEKLKQGLSGKVPSQLLLIPEIVDLPEEDVDRLAEAAEALSRLGLQLEKFGPGAVAVRETPALLGEVDVQSLIRDLADELAEHGTSQMLEERLNAVASTMACHGSIRSGRLMKPDEMNALLRQMETTPNSGQCNHGRPTYIELGLKDIERLFGR
jgi:DNA mismatch repair protein MutL